MRGSSCQQKRRQVLLQLESLPGLSRLPVEEELSDLLRRLLSDDQVASRDSLSAIAHVSWLEALPYQCNIA